MSTPIAQWIDDALPTSNADGCVIIVEDRTQLNLRWAANALTSNGRMHSRDATVISFRGARTASVTAPVAGAEELTALVAQADAASEQAPESGDAMPLVEGERDADFAEGPVSVEPEEFARLTGQLGDAFKMAVAEGHLLYGFAELHRSTCWLASSTGLRRRAVVPMGRFEFTAKAPDLQNSAYVGQQTNDFTDVDVLAHHAELKKRLEWGKTRIDLPAGKYETIMSPSTVVDLFYPMWWDFGLRAAREGRSAFKGAELGETRVGEKFAELPLSIWSDPTDPTFPLPPFAVIPHSMPDMASVFDNGAPVGRQDWFVEGVLRQLVAPRAEAKRAGIDGPLAFAVDNMIVDAQGTTSLEDMIGNTKRGLLLTTMWYIRTVDPQTLLLTGLTRDGVYLIEDGEVKGAVNNFRWNESPLGIMQRAVEATPTEHCLCREWNDWFVRSKAPYLRVRDFNMSTVSQAH